MTAELIDLMARQPEIGQLVLDMGQVQPELDPQAGYGFFAFQQFWFSLKLSANQQFLLCEACRNDPVLLYVVVRAMSFKYMARHDLLYHLFAGIELPFTGMLSDLCGFVPDFNRNLAAKHLAGTWLPPEAKEPADGYPTSPAEA